MQQRRQIGFKVSEAVWERMARAALDRNAAEGSWEWTPNKLAKALVLERYGEGEEVSDE